MKITPCWFVGNWIAAWFQCRLQSRLPRVWATLHQPRCQQHSTRRRRMFPPRAARRAVQAQAVPLLARAAMAAALTLALPAAALAKVVPAAAAGVAQAKAPAAAAKVSS